MARILIIDDDPKVRATLRQMLEREGHRVSEAADGEAGIELFQKEPTEVVITNIYMPEKEGLATIRELRRDFPGLGIIAISGGDARGRTDVLRIAKTFGVSHALPKPVDWGALKAAVDDLIEKSQ